MKSIAFTNIESKLEEALENFLKIDIKFLDIKKFKDILTSFKGFSETIYKITLYLFENSNLKEEEKLNILTFIENNNFIGFINSELLLFRIKCNLNSKKHDEVNKDFEKYNIIELIKKNEFAEDFIIIYLRILTKQNKFDTIIDFYNKNIKNENDDIKGTFNFNINQKNIVYNYIARACANIYNERSKSLIYLKKAEQITPITDEIEIRNYRYHVICAWLNDNYKLCIEIATAGILQITAKNLTTKYLKYYSDLNRMCGASLLNIKKITEAESHCKNALETIKNSENYSYEKFWIDFLICSIYRNQKNYKLAYDKIKAINNNPNYREIIDSHHEAKYKLLSLECKIKICIDKEIGNAIAILKSRQYINETQNYSKRKYNRLLLLAEAHYKMQSFKNFSGYLYYAEIFAQENYITTDDDTKYLELKNLMNEIHY